MSNFDCKTICLRRNAQSGFTLVEIIVGIVITGISLSVVTTLIYPLFVRSVDPMLQIRAAEYGQAIMQDILSKPYDASAAHLDRLPMHVTHTTVLPSIYRSSSSAPSPFWSTYSSNHPC